MHGVAVPPCMWPVLCEGTFTWTHFCFFNIPFLLSLLMLQCLLGFTQTSQCSYIWLHCSPGSNSLSCSASGNHNGAHTSSHQGHTPGQSTCTFFFSQLWCFFFFFFCVVCDCFLQPPQHAWLWCHLMSDDSLGELPRADRRAITIMLLEIKFVDSYTQLLICFLVPTSHILLLQRENLNKIEN